MAVIKYPIHFAEKRTGLGVDEIIETLNALGMPTERIEDEMLETEITPDRPDMIAVEGVIRAINMYKTSKPVIYKVRRSNNKVNVMDVSERPYICIGIVRNVRDKEFLFESLIELQEKLHQTVGRKRKKVAIGIHDLDKVEFPLTYKEVKEETFIPLEWDMEATVEDILSKHEKGMAYNHLVKKGKYPMLYDNKGVISFPPIINSNRTKITEDTENFLIDVTGTHKETVEKVLNIIMYALGDRGGILESVEIIKGNKKFICPNKEIEKMVVNVEDVNKLLGLNLGESEIEHCLNKMGIPNKVSKGIINIDIPPYRADIMHWYDIAEDVAIGYGYEKITPINPNIYWEGKENENEKKWNEIREIMISLGFIETKSFFLGDKKIFDTLSKGTLLNIENPLTEEINTARPSIIYSLIENESLNKMKRLPHNIFEIGHIYVDGKENIEMGFLIADKEINVEEGIGVIKSLIRQMGLEGKAELKEKVSKEFSHLKIEKIFIKGRVYSISSNNAVFIVGEVSPVINEMFQIQNPLIIGLMRFKNKE